MTYENSTLILHSPFDFNVHKKTFFNYLEVVILENGTIEYATPSHERKLLEVTTKKFNIDEEKLYESFEKDAMSMWYFEICSYNTKCMTITNDYAKFWFKPTEAQMKTVRRLIEEGICSFDLLHNVETQTKAFEKHYDYLRQCNKSTLDKIEHYFERTF